MQLVLFVIACFLYATTIFSQTAENDSSTIELIFSNKLKGVQNETGDYLRLEGNVQLRQNQMNMWCDMAHRYPTKLVSAFGNVEMHQNDQIRAYADTLYYDGNTKKSQLLGKVQLEDPDLTLKTRQLFYDLSTKIATYPNGAKVYSDSAVLSSKSGRYEVEKKTAYFSDSVLVLHPSYTLKCDSLAYQSELKRIQILSPTRIFNQTDSLFCSAGYFDNKNKNALLYGNPSFVKQTKNSYQRAKADTIFYNHGTQTYYLIGNARFEDEDKIVFADTIIRYQKTNSFDFIGKPIFLSKDSSQQQRISAEKSFYDGNSESILFQNQVKIEDKKTIVTADSLRYFKKDHLGKAMGQVIWKDTSSNTQIICSEAEYNDSLQYFKALQHPVMLSVQDADTFWLSADVFELTTLENNKKRMKAFRQVKMYKSDFQGVCDSLSYDETDSTFHFFGSPVIWADSAQFIADTISAQISQNKLRKAHFYQNALMISTQEELYFNQIKGKEMKSTFVEGKVNQVNVDSNAVCIYYVMDEAKRYVGVNQVESKDILIQFIDNKVDQVRFRKKPVAIMHPMGQIEHQQLLFKEFKWHENKRPKSKFDVISIHSILRQFLY